VDGVFDLAWFPICKTLGFRKRKKTVDFQIISEFLSSAYRSRRMNVFGSSNVKQS